MPFTSAAVELFISKRVTQLTVCNAVDLSKEFPDATGWVSGFGLLVIFNDQPPLQHRPFVLRLVLRAELALADYALGREALMELVSGDKGKWSPYFRALSRFESALAQLYQGLDSVAKLSGQMLFHKNDDSVEDRLNKLHNTSKHALAREDQPLWITNDGIESSEVALAFHEIEGVLRSLAACARRWSSSTPTDPREQASDSN